MFSPFNSNGSNFLEWVNDAKTDFAANNLAATLETYGVEDIEAVYKFQALLTLRRHLDQTLQV